MVATFKEFVFDFNDLKLSIVCENCKTEITIDASKPPFKLPQKCGPCNHEFGEVFFEAIEDFCSACKVFSDKEAERPFLARMRIHSELQA
jgi:hypothetical protein